MPLWSLWWVWMAAALVLATLEVIVPGYFFLGFAAGAAAMGVLLLLGLTGLGLPAILVIFAAMSLVAVLVMRRVFNVKQGHVKIWDRDVNDN